MAELFKGKFLYKLYNCRPLILFFFSYAEQQKVNNSIYINKMIYASLDKYRLLIQYQSELFKGKFLQNHIIILSFLILFLLPHAKQRKINNSIYAK